jgi:hypothetical protein
MYTYEEYASLLRIFAEQYIILYQNLENDVCWHGKGVDFMIDQSDFDAFLSTDGTQLAWPIKLRPSSLYRALLYNSRFTGMSSEATSNFILNILNVYSINAVILVLKERLPSFESN